MSKRKASQEPDAVPTWETVETIDDLLAYRHQPRHSEERLKIGRISKWLRELRDMVGLEDIKKQIVGHILYYIQGFHSSQGQMMHTVITGSPGTGKTKLAQILAHIYQDLGVIRPPPVSEVSPPSPCRGRSRTVERERPRGHFVIARRADLIGQYLGQTAAKTQAMIDKALGGVLFIDEAYSLGHAGRGEGGGTDSYSKECIDTLNQNLTEKKDQFMCIIAGYEKDLESCFFAVNAGLKRRFPFVYSIHDYSADQLYQMFKRHLWEMDKTWSMDSLAITREFFAEHRDKFSHHGGDIEALLFHTKIEHAKRVLLLEQCEKRNITREDLQRGFETFLRTRAQISPEDVKKSGYSSSTELQMMYL